MVGVKIKEGEWRMVKGMKRCLVAVGSPVAGSALPDGGELTSIFLFRIPRGQGVGMKA